jgi:hypothetical protein
LGATRMPLLPPHSSYQSTLGAGPCNEDAVQDPLRETLPENISDKDLSIEWEACFALPNNDSRNTPQTDLDEVRDASSVPWHPAVGSAPSAGSPNSMGSRDRRVEGSNHSEKDRINAQAVRNLGACFRCARKKEKVLINYVKVHEKLKANV